jgi:hypothetical protein
MAISNHIAQGRIVKLHARPIGIRENLWLLCSQQPCGSDMVQSIVDALMSGFRLKPKV